MQIEIQPPLLNKTIESGLAGIDLEEFGYQKHAGLRPFSTHWRKPRGRGCFHITCDRNNVFRIHRDSFDPRKHPVLHFFEVVYCYIRFPLRYIKQD
jgi:hypothetical protein